MLVILLFLLGAAVSTGASSIYVQYPLQDQLPLIARVNASYSWTFASDTFVSSDNARLNYTTSTLPAWLFFDPSTLTLHGTPSPSDEGTPGFSIVAHDPVSSSSASSYMTLCVTPYAPPNLHVPVAQQFNASNPSLSSVFLLSPDSALDTSNPSLRIPPSWSFSVGFLYDTYITDNDLYYAGLQADGTPLPSWITFNPDEITFDGVSPSLQNSTSPMTVSLALHVSDQEGYSAASSPFDLVVAAHELSLSTASLPTINVTAATPFNFSLNSPDDFYGVLIDGQPVQASEILNLTIDTSHYSNWLHYDSGSRTLTGNPPTSITSSSQDPVLPATVISINQTIQTNVSLAIVPSYFSTAVLQPVLVLPGHALSYDLVQYFSNSSGLGIQRNDVNLTAAFDPPSAGNYLNFDATSAQLTGTVPANLLSSGASYSHISVTFTAYSHVTHSTSHTSLPISLSNADYSKQPSHGLSPSAREKMLLGLKIAFGIISGLVILGMALAVFRRCARVPDSAVLGEEGRNAWTEDEMKWYGIGIRVDGAVHEGPASELNGSNGTIVSEKGVQEGSEKYGNIGLGLHRVLTRTASNPQSHASPLSPGVMRKGEFVGRLKATARIVSDKYRSISDTYKRAVGRSKRPVISKPILIMASDNRVSTPGGPAIDGLPINSGPSALDAVSRRHPQAIPFEDMDLSQYAPSGITSMANSPSSSTGERSIPRRRADFVPPKVPTLPQAHLDDAHAHKPSVDSVGSDTSSLASNSSARTHEVDAVVQTATRANSVHSTSVLSFLSADTRNVPESGRPRLVPFTSASRVPVPKLPSALLNGEPDKSVPASANSAGNKRRSKRVVSQVAKVFRDAQGELRAAEKGTDELAVGITYVRALGDDAQSAGSLPHSPSGSFSLESSYHGHERPTSTGTSVKIPIVPRMLARTGEQFKFRVPVSYNAGSPTTKKPKALVARLISGKALPKFIKIDLDAIASGAGARLEKRVVEFWGVPQARDVGELNVGIYEKVGEKCVGRVIIEVVERS
ncbi:hypothetical protein BKA93DRAFT_927289 [Sparassis latifolia]